MTQTTAYTLRKAKDLISNPENWNKDGDYFKNGDPDTGCMCAYGALGVAMGISPRRAKNNDRILHFVSTELSGMDVISYNDDRDTTHEDIMSLFDKSIELAEGEG